MSTSIFPFTLAYKDNPILPTYQKAFFQELFYAWRKCTAFLGSPQTLLAADE
jgi:hypothetical protein